MHRLAAVLAASTFLLGFALPALAHFGMVVPDANIVTAESPKTVKLAFMFRHPMENSSLELEKPKAELLLAGKKTDLTAVLAETPVDGKKAWSATVPVKAPGAYIFSMIPPPYYEKAEDKFIVHYTKTVVGALGADEGWDAPAGLKIEIMPLTRPYGLYAGNSFTAKVLAKGKPLAGKNVEIEFYNQGGKLKAPADPYITQIAKTGTDGSFTFTAPWAGWWGFAALTEDDAKIKLGGKDKPVEIGGVMWVYFHEPLVK
jgi:cobalt/nickel transport protein